MKICRRREYNYELTAILDQPVGLDNAIVQLTEDGVPGPLFVHDLRGNLIYDGNYVYRYDAFSRLIGVYERGTAHAPCSRCECRLYVRHLEVIPRPGLPPTMGQDSITGNHKLLKVA